MAVSAIPAGYTSVTPYLVVKDAARALSFYEQAFDAKVFMRMEEPSGRIGHAEMKIGNAIVMIADEYPEMNFLGPQTIGGTSTLFMIYVEDVDTSFKKAIAAGAKELRPVADQFYGDRSGTLEDPFGHRWTISTHKEDVSPEELQRRQDAMIKQQK